MKFIPGKYYKTRDGRKARFVGEFYDSVHQDQEILFEFSFDEESIIRGYCEDGRIGFNCDELDIVSEWCDHPSVMSHEDAGTFYYYCGRCKEPVEFVFATEKHKNKEKPKKIEYLKIRQKQSVFTNEKEAIFHMTQGMYNSIKDIAERVNEIIDAVNELRDK